MSCISISITAGNQADIAAKIVSKLYGKTFNVVVDTLDVLFEENGLRKDQVKKLKYCGRKVSGTAGINGLQMNLRFSPAQSISWDLNVERVTVQFADDGDIVVCRVFSNNTHRKIVRLTESPI